MKPHPQAVARCRRTTHARPPDKTWPQRGTTLLPLFPHTIASNGLEYCVAIPSWFALTQHESHTTNGMDQLEITFLIYLFPQPRDVNVDDIVERCTACRFLPHVPSQHFTRYQVIP